MPPPSFMGSGEQHGGAEKNKKKTGLACCSGEAWRGDKGRESTYCDARAPDGTGFVAFADFQSPSLSLYLVTSGAGAGKCRAAFAPRSDTASADWPR